MYDVMKLAWDHREDFRAAHANGRLLADGQLPNIMLASYHFHPAARRFFEEPGMTYGMPAHAAHRAGQAARGLPHAIC